MNVRLDRFKRHAQFQKVVFSRVCPGLEVLNPLSLMVRMSLLRTEWRKSCEDPVLMLL